MVWSQSDPSSNPRILAPAKILSVQILFGPRFFAEKRVGIRFALSVIGPPKRRMPGGTDRGPHARSPRGVVAATAMCADR